MRILLTVFCFTLLCACQQPGGYFQSIQLKPENRKHTKDVKWVIGAEEFNPFQRQQVNGATGAQFGLVGFLVEAAIVSSQNVTIQKRNAMIISIKEQIEKFKLADRFKTKLLAASEKSRWLNINTVRSRNTMQRFRYDTILQDTQESALFISDLRIKFVKDFRVLRMETEVSMLPNNDVLKNSIKDSEEDYTYRNQLVFDYDLGSMPKPKSDIAYLNEDYVATEDKLQFYVDKWNRNNQRKLINALQNGVNLLVYMLMVDLETGVTSSKTVTVNGVRGSLIKKTKDVQILRLDNGNLYTVLL